MMYSKGLEPSEIEQLESRMTAERRTDKDPFKQFTDVLLEFVGSGEWRNRSDAFLAMCAKASFLRGKYGFNQVLARGTTNLACKGYAAAAYCRQSLDPRWLNNLRNITNQAWQSKDYIVFAELSGELAAVLIDLGYTDHATEVATESIEKVTKDSAKNQEIRANVQAALLRARIIHAYIASRSISWVADAKNTEGVMLLNIGQLQDARDTFEELLIIQQQLNNQVGLAKTLINVGEIDRTLGQIDQMETYNRRALEISQEAEYIIGIATATANLGDVELRKGNMGAASDLYERSIKLAEDAGMKSFLVLALFLTADAHFLTGEFDDAIAFYKRAREVSDEIGWPLSAFNADVSVLVTQWAQEVEPDPDIVKSVEELMGKSAEWLSSSDSNLMREVRRKIYEDSSMESDLCAFFDGERNFECRVERKALAKECFGNLFWMGSLCPYFKEFLARFYGQ